MNLSTLSNPVTVFDPASMWPLPILVFITVCLLILLLNPRDKDPRK